MFLESLKMKYIRKLLELHYLDTQNIRLTETVTKNVINTSRIGHFTKWRQRQRL